MAAKKQKKKVTNKKKIAKKNINYSKKKTTSNINQTKKNLQSKNDINNKVNKRIVKVKKVKLKKSGLFLILIILLIVSVVCIMLIKKNNIKTEDTNLSIKLNGENSVSLEYGSEYQDEGATALYGDLNVTNKIKVDTDIDFKKIGKYYYNYSITYGNKTKYVKRTVSIVDSKAPVITLIGNKELTIYIGDKYNDKGAKATDNYDGDISEKIKIKNELNNKKTGSYKVIYTVIDSSGNESSIIRTIKVLEKKKETSNSSKQKSSLTDNKVIGKSSKGYTIERNNGIYYVGGILIANKTYELPSTYNPGGLKSVFTTNFNKMKDAAKKDGVSLKVISGFRSYNTQKYLYNNYVKADGKAAADRYSARPGHSEHQTGLAADINKISYTWGDTKEGKWLNDNCYKYGFVIRYTKDGESKTGYKFEPWHIRYLGVDIATKLYNKGNWITLEEYLGITSKYS